MRELNPTPAVLLCCVGGQRPGEARGPDTGREGHIPMINNGSPVWDSRSGSNISLRYTAAARAGIPISCCRSRGVCVPWGGPAEPLVIFLENYSKQFAKFGPISHISLVYSCVPDTVSLLPPLAVPSHQDSATSLHLVSVSTEQRGVSFLVPALMVTPPSTLTLTSIFITLSVIMVTGQESLPTDQWQRCQRSCHYCRTGW